MFVVVLPIALLLRSSLLRLHLHRLLVCLLFLPTPYQPQRTTHILIVSYCFCKSLYSLAYRFRSSDTYPSTKGQKRYLLLIRAALLLILFHSLLLVGLCRSKGAGKRYYWKEHNSVTFHCAHPASCDSWKSSSRKKHLHPKERFSEEKREVVGAHAFRCV